jgi:hypothetical protein
VVAKKRSKYSSKKTTKQELSRRLTLSLIGIVALTLITFISLSFFAPQIGSLFGLISKYRNQEEEQLAVKPNPPILSDLPNATKDKEIDINGYAQPGMTVKLYVNGPEKDSTTVGADGLFTFTEVNLNSGRNTIFAKAFDTYNTESDKSKTYVLNVDTKKPELDIEEPDDGETVRNLNERVTVEGKVNEKANVTVNGKIAVVRPDLSFEFLLGVKEGSVEINVVATDEAGNQTEETIYIKYEKKSR